jgi:AcrR family transcriptional regulator
LEERPPQIKTRLSRGRLRRVADRQQILAAARDIGIRSGWKAVTIRSIGHALNYTAPVLYEHFKNKEEVLTAVAAEGFDLLERQLRGGDGETILDLAEHYWCFALNNAQLYRLMNGAEGGGELLGQAAEKVCACATEAIEDWLADKRATGVNAAELADEVWALLHGMAMLRLDRGIPFEAEQVRRCVLKMLQGVLQ